MLSSTIPLLLTATLGAAPASTHTSETEPGVGDADATVPASIDPLEPTTSATPTAPLPGGVDLWDESTWSELTVEQKDTLRAERARRRAKGEQASTDSIEEEAAIAAVLDAPSATTEFPRPRDVRVGPTRLEGYWHDKHLTLRRLTIGFSAAWGAAIVGSGVLAGLATREPKAEPPTNMSFGTGDQANVSNSREGTGLVVGAVIVGCIGFVGMVGTLVSASMLGAHNNAKPLYFGGGRGGLTLRF